MSTLSGSPDVSVPDRPALSEAPAEAGDRSRRWVSFVVTAVVLALSVAEVVNLLGRHTNGPELYGVLVAVLASVAGIASLVLVASRRKRFLASAAVLVLWAAIALGGLAGTYAHIVGAPAGEGPLDPRPRPVSAPLIFTALGAVGGAALFYGQRMSAVRLPDF
jgi:hypothetical protein